MLPESALLGGARDHSDARWRPKAPSQSAHCTASPQTGSCAPGQHHHVSNTISTRRDPQAAKSTACCDTVVCRLCKWPGITRAVFMLTLLHSLSIRPDIAMQVLASGTYLLIRHRTTTLRGIQSMRPRYCCSRGCVCAEALWTVQPRIQPCRCLREVSASK